MHARLLTLCTLLFANAAVASGGLDESASRYAAANPLWKAECSACHIAYPARMLPAASWKAMMAGLDRHFGTDASLDPKATADILAYLVDNAGTRKPEPAAKPVLRITETRWFQNEHDEVPNRLWKDPRVKSPANCAACHTRADQGSFDEHAIRLPK